MTVTAIIVTLNRPTCVKRCLERLTSQDPSPNQIIVVDASDDNQTEVVVSAIEGIHYIRHHRGIGQMTASRNIGLKSTVSDIVAFVDDDAFAQPGWLAALLVSYSDPKVGAVGGRALNRQPGEDAIGRDAIGRLLPDGSVTGNFAADPGCVIEVDHIIGCNMSFRRHVLATLGGFRTDYGGISGVREDTDMCLRVKGAGYRILFNPAAVVDHIGAPQAKGRRFDWRYDYYAQRNHTAMLVRNFGFGSGVVWCNIRRTIYQVAVDFAKRSASAIVHLLAAASGFLSGLTVGTKLLLSTGLDPVRRDADGDAVREVLKNNINEPILLASKRIYPPIAEPNETMKA